MAKDKKKNTKEKIAAGKKAVGKGLLKIVFGDPVSSRLLGKHMGKIAIATLLALGYIGFKYECQVSIEKIDRLQDSLAIVESESIRERSLYMSRIKESSMQHLVDSMHLKLRIQKQPPYSLKYDE